MATENVTEYDKEGNVVSTGTVEIPPSETNRRAITEQAVTAHANNRTFLAVALPTNVQLAAQVKALTRQNNGLIRLVLNQLEGAD